jgi:glycosyltransferase involved in cell wall biosynthesis
MLDLISILIPTKGRMDGLQDLLGSLSRMDGRESIPHEVVVINNAPDETAVESVRELVQAYIDREGDRWRHVREPIPGKSRALNRGIALAHGNILAFLDDDVVVDPLWLATTHNFFTETSFDIEQGAIKIPPELADNAEFLTLLQRYRTIFYLTQSHGDGDSIKSLNAANLAMRRELFYRTGYFDERLGPGASGTSMDSEFGERVKKFGGRLGYEPRSVVYHRVDWSRLTDEYFRWRNEAEGLSNYLYKDPKLPSIIYNLLRSTLGFCLYSAMRSTRKKYRMKGRCFRYQTMLKAKMQDLGSRARAAFVLRSSRQHS